MRILTQTVGDLIAAIDDEIIVAQCGGRPLKIFSFYIRCQNGDRALSRHHNDARQPYSVRSVMALLER